MLGYFSVIGLLRVHVLLGDFTLALKVMENVELNQRVSAQSWLNQSLHIHIVSKSPFSRVTACHVTTYYYVGFCYIMLKRYPDAIRTFVTILNFIMRMRQYHTRSYQYDQVSIRNPPSPVLFNDISSRLAKLRIACMLSLQHAMHFHQHASMTTSGTLPRRGIANSMEKFLVEGQSMHFPPARDS